MQKKLEQDKREIESQKKQVQEMLEITLEALSQLKGSKASEVLAEKAKKVQKRKPKEEDSVTRALLGDAALSSESSEEPEVEESSSEAESPQDDLQSANPDKNPKVFLRNVPLTATEDDLSAYVEEGTGHKPKKVWNVTDPEGKFYGRSFVEMNDWKEAVAALNFLSKKVSFVFAFLTEFSAGTES